MQSNKNNPNAGSAVPLKQKLILRQIGSEKTPQNEEQMLFPMIFKHEEEIVARFNPRIRGDNGQCFYNAFNEFTMLDEVSRALGLLSPCLVSGRL